MSLANAGEVSGRIVCDNTTKNCQRTGYQKDDTTAGAATDSAGFAQAKTSAIVCDADVGRKASLRKYFARIAQRNERSFSGRCHGSFESIRTTKIRHG